MKKSIFVFVLLVLVGCTSIDLMPVVPETRDFFRPYPSGVPMERSIGEEMIGYSLLLRAQTYPGFIAQKTIGMEAPFGYSFPEIEEGSKWVAVGKTEGGDFYCKNTKKRMVAYLSNPLGVPTEVRGQVCLIISPDGKVKGGAFCSNKPFDYDAATNMFNWKTPVKIMTPTNILKRRGVKARKASIVYAGRSGNVIRLIYRETASKDLELTYDLAESDIVAVRDISFRILKATNSSIKYVIRTKPDALKEKLRRRLKTKRETSIL